MRKFPWKLIIILLLAWAILTVRVGDIFTDAREAPHVWAAAAVRTIDTYGLDTIGLVMTRNTAPIASPDEIMYYSHHPPTMVWVPLLSTRFLGFHEVGVRFPFLAFTLLTICLLYVFTRRLINQKTALWAAFFYSIAPYTNYFGRIPGHDLVGFFWVMLYALVILEWIRQPKRWHTVALSVLVWVAVWTAWTADFFIAALGITAMVLGQRHHRIRVVWFGVLAVIAFLTLVGFYQLQWDGSINSLLEAYVWRSSTASYTPDSPTFTAFGWVTHNLGHILIFATIGISFLCLFGIPELLKANKTTRAMIIGLFAGSLSYQLAFLNASYVHDVDKASFTIVMSILAALGVNYLDDARRRRWGRPLWQALTVLVLVQGILVTGMMHTSGRKPLLRSALELAQNAPESAQLAIELPDIANTDVSRIYQMVLQFYTYRSILWNVGEHQVQAAAEDQPVFYINCILEQGAVEQNPVTCRSELLE